MKFIHHLFSLSILALSVYIFLKNIKKSEPQVAVLILEFENFANTLFETIEDVCTIVPRVIVYSETFIYPPVNLSTIQNCGITVVEMNKSVFQSHKEKDIYHVLEMFDYLLVLPDSTIILNNKTHSLINELLSSITLVDALLIPINSNSNETFEPICQNFNFDIKRWTLEYFDNRSEDCFYQNENGFAIFVKRQSFFQLSFPLIRPFVKSFLIQSQVAKLRNKLWEESLFLQHSNPFSNKYLQDKHDRLEKYRNEELNFKLGIKKILYQNKSIEWQGCNRNKPRCFDTIINDVPDYLIKNRWMPPCCKHNLETTGRYVFGLLEKFHIRYWLEGGSLLGAVRNGQIIDWDYDIDIGIYQEDMVKLPTLKNMTLKKPGYRLIDGQGFVWERALEGNFIKVHYSLINRVHVDIFPFFLINGTMTKDTWFPDHPQDMPFPEHYLKPLERVSFIGVNVCCPNKMKQFLEMKFGKGAIETPKYPKGYKIELDFI